MPPPTARRAQHLLQFHNAKDKGVRFRVCQLVAGVINALPDDAEIRCALPRQQPPGRRRSHPGRRRSDDLWSELVEKMMMRCKDKITVVREFAVEAVKRLQDHTDPEDKVMSLLLRTLQTDSSKCDAVGRIGPHWTRLTPPPPRTLLAGTCAALCFATWPLARRRCP